MPTSHQPVTAFLNPILVERNKLDSDDIRALQDMHRRMTALLDRIDANEDPARDGHLVEEVEQLEYEMQRRWKFREDPRFHTHWSRPRRCSCRAGIDPDYGDGFGEAYRTISGDCPLHAGHTFLAIPTVVQGTRDLIPSRRMLESIRSTGGKA